ncbi:MAG: LysE family transporter [Bacteroidota bacterium]
MAIQVFFIAFAISLLGSIPPGTINITAMKMGILGQTRPAYFLILGATIVEFFYAFLVLKFQQFINRNIELASHFTLVTGLVLCILGIYSLRSHSTSETVKLQGVERRSNGFVKGVALGFLNPLAIPFWLTVTVYLETNGWIQAEGVSFWTYLIGIFFGSIVTLVLAIRLGNRFTAISDNQLLVHVLPGVVFLSLGGYNLYQWIFSLGH